MKNKFNLISAVLLIFFLFIGWKIGISPLRESVKKIKQSGSEIRNKLAGGLAVNIPSNYISENQYKIDILHYDLSLDLYPKKELLKGEAQIKGVLLDKTLKQIDLNFYDNMRILDVNLNGKKIVYKNSGTSLSIPIVKIIPDTFNIKIIYKGTPEKMGFGSFVFGEIYKHSLVYNLSEPAYASTWFPCNDLPSDKALLDIKITNDTSEVSVSNGILVDTLMNGDRKTYHWKTNYPISTYLICLYSSNYKNFSEEYVSQNKKDTMKIQYYALPEHLTFAKNDFAGHPKMIDFFAKTYGEYPFIKEKYGVAEFLWQFGAMEHQTITGIGTNFVSGRGFFKDIYIHELAHQWFGDAVGPETWKDVWLNEGFASYSEALYYEHLSGQKALQSTMLSKFQDHYEGTLYNPSSLFNSTVYDKGAWVLNMLRFETGDSTFFKILKTYFDRYKYKNASTDDFKKICEEVSNKNLDKFFDQWVFTGEENINLYYNWNFEKNKDSNDVFIKLSQTQKNYKTFYFPLEIRFDNDDESSENKRFYITSRDTTLKIELPEKPKNIVLDPNSWLLANIQEKEKK